MNLSAMMNIKAISLQAISLLEGCSSMEELKSVHAQMVKTRLVKDTLLISKVLSFCTLSERGSMAYAKMVFDRFSLPNTFMWNTMIKAFSDSEAPKDALRLYIEMLSWCPLVFHNAYTFPFVLKACSKLEEGLEETKQVHAQVFKLGFESEIFALNSLIHTYAGFGDTKSAFLVFSGIQNRDIVSWNSMMDAFAKSGELAFACELFNQMPEKNIVSWTTMMSSFVKACLYNECLEIFYDMQSSGLKPDKAAASSALKACAQLGALEQGIWIHALIKKLRIKIDSILGCVLIDMYSKCGDLENAIEVFLELKDKKASVEIWTTMIMGYGVHGKGRDALNLFREMEKVGIKPSPVTFTALLTSCSYGGFVDEGRMFFERMKSVDGIRPSIEHYGCMVDLLSRKGLLKEAKEVITKMPLNPNGAILGSLLNGCRIHGNVELGKEVGKALVRVDPGHGGRYVNLASVYCVDGEWDEAIEVRRDMEKHGVMKSRGCSSIVGLDGIVHEFYADGEVDAHTRDICKSVQMHMMNEY